MDAIPKGNPVIPQWGDNLIRKCKVEEIAPTVTASSNRARKSQTDLEAHGWS